MHSVSEREHLLLWYSRQTSRVNHRESFMLGLAVVGTMTIWAVGLCTSWAMVAGEGAGVSSVVVATAGVGGGVTARKECGFKPRSQGGEGEGVGKLWAVILAGWRGTLCRNIPISSLFNSSLIYKTQWLPSTM